jgi:hypothetical protein
MKAKCSRKYLDVRTMKQVNNKFRMLHKEELHDRYQLYLIPVWTKIKLPHQILVHPPPFPV